MLFKLSIFRYSKYVLTFKMADIFKISETYISIFESGSSWSSLQRFLQLRLQLLTDCELSVTSLPPAVISPMTSVGDLEILNPGVSWQFPLLTTAADAAGAPLHLTQTATDNLSTLFCANHVRRNATCNRRDTARRYEFWMCALRFFIILVLYVIKSH